MTNDFSQYYVATEPGRRERAHAWATAIGLQDVDGLKPSKYLIATAKRHIHKQQPPIKLKAKMKPKDMKVKILLKD